MVPLYLLVATVDASKLERDRPPVPNERKKEHQRLSAYIYIPTFLESTVTLGLKITQKPHTTWSLGPK